MNDLIKVNSENQNQAIDRCQQILQDRREALASKAKRRASNPQPIGFRGNLLVKRPKFFYCTYSLGITETS